MTSKNPDKQPTKLQRLNIALALVALKYKPSNQSIASYVLDLRGKFPIKPLDDNASLTNNPWREKVLTLEEEIVTLKRKAERDHAEVLELRAKNANLENSSTQAEVSNEVSAKKKKRKLNNGAKASDDFSGVMGMKLNLELLIKNSPSSAFNLPAITDSLSILTSYQKLSLSELQAQDSSQKSTTNQKLISEETLAKSKIILLTASDLINGLGSLLNTTLKSPTKNSVESLKTIESILCTSLISICDLIPPSKYNLKTKTTSKNPQKDTSSLDINNLLSALTSQILQPLIKSFYTLSTNFISSILQATSKSKKSSRAIDIRPDVLALTRRILAITKEKQLFAEIMQDLYDFIALESAQQIKRLWSDADHGFDKNNVSKYSQKADNTENVRFPNSLSRNDRIRRLARKDACWYHCTLLQEVLTLPSTAQTANQGTTTVSLTTDLIIQKIVNLLNSLFSLCKDALAPPSCEEDTTHTLQEAYNLDDIEKGMIMAILEKAWLHGYMGFQ